jgi:hypothetical protein
VAGLVAELRIPLLLCDVDGILGSSEQAFRWTLLNASEAKNDNNRGTRAMNGLAAARPSADDWTPGPWAPFFQFRPG